MSYLIENSVLPLHRNWDLSQMVGADNIQEIQQNILQYLNNPEVFTQANNLYIYSDNNGNGKSRAANWIVEQLHQPRLQANGTILTTTFAIVSFTEYLKFCGNFKISDEQARERIMTVPILLLDDVSAAFGSNNLHTDRRELLSLMKYRREHMLITIITSNLTPAAFDKVYGPTASSKALENFSYIEVRGADVRQAIYPDQFQDPGEEDEEACR
jgi:DNA replication protein DnaC